MIFGIGSGLLFFYLPWLKVNSAPGVTYRTVPGAIFSKVARRVGFSIKRQHFSSPARAQQTLDDCLAKGMPVGLQVGVYNLVYLPDEYRFHFNAHNLVVYGKEGNEYLIELHHTAYRRRTRQGAFCQRSILAQRTSLLPDRYTETVYRPEESYY